MNKIQENPKIILVLQSRLGSSRLPQKALYPLGKKTVLHQVLSNLKACEVSDFWLATDFSSESTFSCSASASFVWRTKEYASDKLLAHSSGKGFHFANFTKSAN